MGQDVVLVRKAADSGSGGPGSDAPPSAVPGSGKSGMGKQPADGSGSGPNPGGSRTAKLTFWDPVAVVMILLACFTRLLVTEGRDPGELNFLVMAAALLVAAALCVLLIALRPASLRPTLLTVLTGAVLYMESGFPLPPDLEHWLLTYGGPTLTLAMRLVAYVLPIAVFYWMARDRLSQILTVIFGAIAVFGLLSL